MNVSSYRMKFREALHGERPPHLRPLTSGMSLRPNRMTRGSDIIAMAHLLLPPVESVSQHDCCRNLPYPVNALQLVPDTVNFSQTVRFHKNDHVDLSTE